MSKQRNEQIKDKGEEGTSTGGNSRSNGERSLSVVRWKCVVGVFSVRNLCTLVSVEFKQVSLLSKRGGNLQICRSHKSVSIKV